MPIETKLVFLSLVIKNTTHELFVKIVIREAIFSELLISLKKNVTKNELEAKQFPNLWLLTQKQIFCNAFMLILIQYILKEIRGEISKHSFT